MEQSEQNVVSTPLPKPAALQDLQSSAEPVSDTPGAPVFHTKGVSLYYGSSGPSRTSRCPSTRTR